ncbi:MAG: hypothetical protein QOH88_3450 [Verrucomicrobiota bacterium]|jgi:DNA-binding NarL/FixJ family response regulator
MRILIVDDHALVRAGMRALIERIPGAEVVGEASNGREAIAAVSAELPDLVLMDVSMAELGGLEALPQIIKFPRVKVVMVSGYAKEEYVSRALRAGAAGFVHKDATLAEFQLMIRSLSEGRIYLSPLISRLVIDRCFRGAEDGTLPATLESLTVRQRAVLRLIAEGKKTKEVASELGISVRSVEVHRLEVMRRLRIHDVPGLVRYAVRNGLVDP